MASTESEVRNGDALGSDPGDSTHAIRRDIESTRCEMDQTLEQLGERLRPRNLLDDVLNHFLGPKTTTRSSELGASANYALTEEACATSGPMLGNWRSIRRQLQANPVPTLLIGSGLAWLLLRSDEPAPRRGWSLRGQRDIDDYAEDWEEADEWQGRSEQLAGKYGHTDPTGGLEEHSGSLVDARTGEPYDESYGAEFHQEQPSMMDKVKDAAGTAADKARSAASAVGHAASAVGHAASTAGHAARSAATGTARAARVAGRGMSRVGQRTRSGVTGAAARTRSGMSTAAERTRMGLSSAAEATRVGTTRAMESVRETSRRAGQGLQSGYSYTREGFVRTSSDYPLAVGLGFLALGLFAGLALPHTRREDEWMGETSDEVKERAKETTQEMVERGKETASATLSAAVGQAESEGLTPGSLGEKVARVAERVGQAIADAAHEEGLAPADLKEKARHVAEEAKHTAQSETERHISEVKGEESSASSESKSASLNEGPSCGL